MKTYKTTEVANMIGVHPNTVRLYEKWELIPSAIRQENGYRIFTEFHISCFRLARIGFEIEILQNGLRSKMIQVIKTTAKKEFDTALRLIQEYKIQIEKEQSNANEAIMLVKNIVTNSNHNINNSILFKRSEMANYLDITVDTLRNWELNGLLEVKRLKNGYRVYSHDDMIRLKIIRTLRCANYSLASILRLLNELSINQKTNIKQLLNTPSENEDIIMVCDKLLISLEKAYKNANTIEELILKMKKMF